MVSKQSVVPQATKLSFHNWLKSQVNIKFYFAECFPKHQPTHLLFISVLLSVISAITTQTSGSSIYRRSAFRLTSVPSDIPSDAVEIYLDGNSIDSLQADAFSSQGACVHLNISHNHISSVEENALRGLTSLRILDLSHILISHLKADMFSVLMNCKELLLHNNFISEIEVNAFGGLYSLQTLELGFNYISDLFADMFSHITSCTHLSINHNEVSDIDKDAFKGLTNLTILNLGHNSIQSIEKEMWTHLQSCTELYLNHNFISEIEVNVLDGLHVVKTLDFRRNRLTTLKADIFYPLSVLICGWEKMKLLPFTLVHSKVWPIWKELISLRIGLLMLIKEHSSLSLVAPV